MGILITSADFTGKYAIPVSVFTDLENFITDNEESYLVDLLGASLYDDFKADLLNNVPQQARYTVLYNPFNKDYGSKIYKSKGMKDMLCGFIFFQFMRDVKYKATVQGMVESVPDTSVQSAYGKLYKYLNDATETYQSITEYIRVIKSEDYQNPLYNGIKKGYATPMFM